MKTILFGICILMSYVGIAQNKILIVSTNKDSVGRDASGSYVKEIANPFRHFKQAGLEIDVVTPKGGKAAIYGSVTSDLQDIVNDSLYINKVMNTLTPDQVRYKDYAAVFYPGGHGQYFDVVSDERIAALTATIYENKGVIGTAGHGGVRQCDRQSRRNGSTARGR